MIRIEKLEELHIIYLQNNIVDVEVKECLLMSGRNVREILEQTISSNEIALTVLAYGIPISVFGLAPINNLYSTHCVWQLSTERVQRHKRQLIELSKEYLDIFRKRSYFMENYVLCENVFSINYLKHIGFSFDEKVYSINNHDWYRFYMFGDVDHVS